MAEVIRHAPTVAESAAPAKRPTGPMHGPTRRHAQVQCDAGAQACRAALLQAIEILGGGAAAARSLGVPGQSRQTVYQWTRTRVPAEYCPTIERQTRLVGRPIFCEQLRPDVDWGALRPIAAGPATCTSFATTRKVPMLVNEIGGSAKHLSERLLAITLPQLEAALAQWETAARDGLTLSHEESRAMAVGRVAASSAAHLWEILAQAKAPQGGPEKPVVAASGPVFIGIDVMRDEIKIALWRGRKWVAVYAPLGKGQAMAKALPQVIDEAMELARQESCSSASGQFVTE